MARTRALLIHRRVRVRVRVVMGLVSSLVSLLLVDRSYSLLVIVAY
jgi:hypothetical protein